MNNYQFWGDRIIWQSAGIDHGGASSNLAIPTIIIKKYMEKVIINNELFGTGCLDKERIIDETKPISYSGVPFDWETGFNIQLLLGFRATCKNQEEFFGWRGREGWGIERYREIKKIVKDNNIPYFIIPPNNQGASSSCTGHGLAKYLTILNYIETGIWTEISPKDIYAYISLGRHKGGYLYDALNLAITRGVGTEELVASMVKYDAGGQQAIRPMTEDEYLVKPEETEELKAVRTALKGLKFSQVVGSGQELMDNMAWSILMNFGAYFSVLGSNNGSWGSEYPQPPEKYTWGHALYAGIAELDKDGKEFIGNLNSWGNGVGNNGWQKLKLNYFIKSVSGVWGYTDKDNKSNIMSNKNVKIIKDENSSAVGIWLPALSPEALKSLCMNFGIEIPYKTDGSIDWQKWIDGKLTLYR